MNILVSHPTGNANLRAAIAGIDSSKNLLEFHTCLATDLNSAWFRILPAKLRNEFLRRSFPISQDKTVTHPTKELARLVLLKMGLTKWSQHEVGKFSTDQIYRSLDRDVSNRILKFGANVLDAVYAYEDGALSTFKAARNIGISRLYDLPIGYWRSSRKLLQDEMDSHPEWAATLTGFKDSESKLQRKDHELQLADHIFVASSFTRETLNEFPGELPPVHVIPYGFPEVGAKKHYSSLTGRKLKLLFVGGLSQRKGLYYLFEAIDDLEDKVELTIVGRKPVPDCRALNQSLIKHKWIESLPHSDILRLMQEHDAFVFPSLFEGFGLVITEAMSQGVPVITTDRTCGPDIITNGEDGWIINAGSTDEIKNAIESILHEPEKLKMMGNAAQEKARLRPWSKYGSELNEKIISVL